MLYIFQSLAVPRGYLLALGQQFVQALHLNATQRGTQLGQPVVVAQLSVLQPGVSRGAALVAQSAHQVRREGILSNNDTAFTCCNLQVARIHRPPKSPLVFLLSPLYVGARPRPLFRPWLDLQQLEQAGRGQYSRCSTLRP